MDKKDLFKKMLPGLLPLFVFILADEIWGTEIGLYVALGFGIAELLYTYIKTKKVDRFILLDTILLVTLGLVSILLDNDIFFKLKPALIEMILAFVIGFSVFGPKNLIFAMSKRYMKDMEVPKSAELEMNKNLKALFFITILHIGLIIYSAYFLSKEAWAFISGGLFYIVFLVYFSLVYFKRKIHMNKLKKEEWLPVVDEQGNVLGQQARSICHDGNKNFLHPVVHLHYFNEKGELFLQKRPKNKDIQPGKWDTAVGGHVSVNETIEIALQRESKEEIGINIENPQFILKYVWESEVERELVYVFIMKSKQIPITHPEEVDYGKFWTMKEIQNNLKTDIFTPNFENEFHLLKQILH